MCRAAFLGAILFLSLCAQAQNPALQLSGIRENVQLIEHRSSQGRNNVVCNSDTLTLPFFEDFSTYNQKIYPDCAAWQDNHVFINQTMAKNPPSVGVATFDGLSPDGTPYNRLAPPTSIKSDTLTSQVFNLAQANSNSELILSFYYQAKGYADRPEIGDSLVLEFKDNTDSWVTMRAFPGLNNNFVPQDSIPPFQEVLVPILANDFFHKGFQFRFRNKAAIAGNNDHWHIDYIYLDSNRVNSPTTIYEDVALTQNPVSPLEPYTAMPWRHFDSLYWNDTVIYQVFNHSTVTGTLDRLYTVTDTASRATLLTTPLPAAQLPPSPSSLDRRESDFINAFQSFTPTGPTQLISQYTLLNPVDFQSNARFTPNDTAYRYTDLSNFFAYDDGTAETRIEARVIGTDIAVQFNTTVADTLRGVYFHMPYYLNIDASRDFINVKVWINDLNNEVYSQDIQRLEYVDGFNGFYYLEFKDFQGVPQPIGIDANTTFYVGWEQASQISVPIGYDMNNNANAYSFYNTGSGWRPLVFGGAIMMRPLLSPTSMYKVVATEEAEQPTHPLTLYPNPAQTALHIHHPLQTQTNFQVEVYNVAGQRMFQGANTRTLHVHDWPKGLYVLRWINTASGKAQSKTFIKH